MGADVLWTLVKSHPSDLTRCGWLELDAKFDRFRIVDGYDRWRRRCAEKARCRRIRHRQPNVGGGGAAIGVAD